MRYLNTREAATLLSVNAATLRSWQGRFGFPSLVLSPGKHRLFAHREIIALSAARQDERSTAIAIARARAIVVADLPSLMGALASFRADRADAAIEAALALYSVAYTVEEALLPTLDEIARQQTMDSAAWVFAADWAVDWLQRARRLAWPSVGPVSLVVGDASRDALDPDAPRIRAFELFCARAGVAVLSLSTRGVAGIGDAVAVHHPDIVVLAGSRPDDDSTSRWASAVRLAAKTLPVVVYRRGGQRPGEQPMIALPPGPSDAQRRVAEMLDAHRGHRPAPARLARCGETTDHPAPNGAEP